MYEVCEEMFESIYILCCTFDIHSGRNFPTLKNICHEIIIFTFFIVESIWRISVGTLTKRNSLGITLYRTMASSAGYEKRLFFTLQLWCQDKFYIKLHSPSPSTGQSIRVLLHRSQNYDDYPFFRHCEKETAEAVSGTVKGMTCQGV